MYTAKPDWFVEEPSGTYRIKGSINAEQLMDVAAYLGRKVVGSREKLTASELTHRYLQAIMQAEEREVFGIIHLDSQNGILKTEELFFGTIDCAKIYPREVVKSVLSCNTAAVIFFHNHPSGVPEPSEADRRITSRLREALDLVNVKVLDHMVYGAGESVSFAESGLL